MTLLKNINQDSTNKRSAYRVTPSPDENITFSVAGHPATIVNLSETGVAFETEAKLTRGHQQARIAFTIDRPYELEITLVVVDRLPPFYRARIDVEDRGHKLLSRLILECQKHIIQRQKDNK